MGMIRVWHLAMNSGVRHPLGPDDGAQQSIVSDLVDDKTVMNAVSLNAVCLGITGLAFPAMSGMLIEWFGAAEVFYIQTGIYALTVLALLQVPHVRPDGTYREPPARALAAGMRYTARDVVLQGMIIIAMARFLLRWLQHLHAQACRRGAPFRRRGWGCCLGAGLGRCWPPCSQLRDYRFKGLRSGVGLGMGFVMILFP